MPDCELPYCFWALSRPAVKWDEMISRGWKLPLLFPIALARSRENTDNTLKSSAVKCFFKEKFKLIFFQMLSLPPSLMAVWGSFCLIVTLGHGRSLRNKTQNSLEVPLEFLTIKGVLFLAIYRLQLRFSHQDIGSLEISVLIIFLQEIWFCLLVPNFRYNTLSQDLLLLWWLLFGCLILNLTL